MPKTSSGKIMRHLLKNIVEGEDPDDTSGLANPDVIEKTRDEERGQQG